MEYDQINAILEESGVQPSQLAQGGERRPGNNDEYMVSAPPDSQIPVFEKKQKQQYIDITDDWGCPEGRRLNADGQPAGNDDDSDDEMIKNIKAMYGLDLPGLFGKLKFT